MSRATSCTRSSCAGSRSTARSRSLPHLYATDRVDDWKAARAEIESTRSSRSAGANAAGAFTQSFGSDDLDASNLMMPIVGFIAATTRGCSRPSTRPLSASPTRTASSTATCRRTASKAGRARSCCARSCSPKHSRSRASIERATQTMERAVAFANDVGLLAEEVDPDTGELLGNFPQAFSHIGLVNAAWAISQATEQGA